MRRPPPSKARRGGGQATGVSVACLQFSLVILTFVFIAGVFLFMSFHAHGQLGLEQSNTKLFITNQINKFVPHRAIDAILKIEEEVIKIEEELPGAVARIEESLFSELDAGRREFEAVMHQIGVGGGSSSSAAAAAAAGHAQVPEAFLRPTPQPTPEPVPLKHQLDCPHGHLLEFWKPATARDMRYRTPYADSGLREKYVTFEPDVGGWNNVRMQMETVLVFAAATGRTLVLPPDQPMYLLDKGKGHQKAHSFADFFPFDLIKQRVPVIEMTAFMTKEGVTGGLVSKVTGKVQLPPGNKTEFIGTARDDRLAMWGYLRNVTFAPRMKCMKEFVVIPPAPGVNVSLLPGAAEYAKQRDIFAAKRAPVYYDETWHREKVIHFVSSPGDGFRLLEHFYTFIHFEDPHMDRYYKRFVRDFVHYTDLMFCKAAIIIQKLLDEGKGHYNAFHIRRGEFQYKVVKIPADQMLANVGQFIPSDTIVYLASDEKNQSFFKPFRQRYPAVRMLNDYMDLAGLRSVNPNYLGMIDQIVCVRGDRFVGTWFSTFSGYITRMRGYLGYHDHTVWYGDKGHRDRFQHDELPMFPFYMREWNVSWQDIDRY